MTLFRFIFPFLYVRNWYSGAQELSPARVVLFGAMVTLVILAIIIAAFLQAPVNYVVD